MRKITKKPQNRFHINRGEFWCKPIEFTWCPIKCIPKTPPNICRVPLQLGYNVNGQSNIQILLGICK